MPVDTRINVPFIPQEGITSQILNAMQLANEHHQQQQQLAIQQQQANTQQQAAQSESQFRAAQGKEIQANLEAGLPEAQAGALKSRSNYENLQGQIQQENNPLVKEQLKAQARGENAAASLNEAKVAMIQNPTDYSAAVDKVIDPAKYPELNKRTKSQMEFADQIKAFDPEAPAKILGQSASEIDTIERETDPRVIAARVQQTVQTQRGLYGGGAVSGVAPHLVAPATAEATKLGTDFATFEGQLKNLKTSLASAKTGDEVAAQFAPIAITLGSNAFYGTHRFSPTEVEALKDVGSVPRQINSWLDKHATGTVNPDSLKEFQSLVDRLGEAKYSTYKNGLNVVNKNYGSKFDPVDMSGSENTKSGGSGQQQKSDEFGAFGGRGF
jgi:hypothetical protein